MNMTTVYNTQLQANSFNSAGLIGAALSYYSDGRIHTEQRTVDRKFDRAYTYGTRADWPLAIRRHRKP